MAPTPPSTAPIAKTSHKCLFCPRGFPSRAHRERHTNSSHGDRDLLVAVIPPVSPASPPPVAEEVRGACDEDVDNPEGGLSVGGGPPVEGQEDAGPVSMAACSSSQGTGLAVMNAARAFVNESATQFLIRRSYDGVARGAIAGPRPPAGAARHVFATSVAARIRGYYEALPEASLSQPIVRNELGDGPYRFRGPAMRSGLKFALTAAGCGLSCADQANLGGLLLQLEAPQTDSDGAVFPKEFPTEGAFVGGLRQEQQGIVAQLNSLEVLIVVGGKEYFFYHRDPADVALRAVRSAKKLDLLGGALPSAPDGSARRSSTLNSDLFVREAATIRALHGPRDLPLRVYSRQRRGRLLGRRGLRLPDPGRVSLRA